jgi:hypothetical protein
MKQQEVFKKIGIIIKELNDQYEYLVENQNEMNDLEMELFVANAHFLADHSEVLRKLNLNKPELPKALPAPQEKYFEPVVQHSPPPVEAAPVKEEKPEPPVAREIPQTSVTENPVPHIDLRGDDTGADYSYMRQEPEIVRHELKLDDIPSWEEEEEPAAHHPINEIEEAPKAEAPKVEMVQPVPEPIKTEIKIPEEKEEPLTINQRIMAQMNANNNRNAEHVSIQPITDLKQAITLNDKLLYIKDLFNGYNLAYSEAIDILNRFNSFDEADKFLQSSYAAKNNWESKQSTVDKFYDLLKRRYS